MWGTASRPDHVSWSTVQVRHACENMSHVHRSLICCLSCQLTVSGPIGGTGHSAQSPVMEESIHKVVSTWSLHSMEAKCV